MNIHGGDIYRNHVDIDFSINVNPLGTPGPQDGTDKGLSRLMRL